MHIVIFEGSHWRNFAPLSLSRPVFTLVTGMSTLLEKQIRHLSPTRLTLWVRPELEEFCRVRVAPKLKVPTKVNEPLDDEMAMIVNGRTLFFGKFEPPPQEAVFVEEQNLIRVAHARSPGLSISDVMNRTEPWRRLLDLPHMMPQGRMAESLWDLIGWNEESLIEDSTRLIKATQRQKIDGPFHLINEDDVWLGEAAKLEPGCVLDASKGPIVIAEHATVGANSVIQGPCYIGPYSSVRPLTLIRPGVSIGTLCKVGGELSNSILLGYSNKAHDGYLGDSYLGKWVNLGAGTTTSNLKNTYGEVSVKLGEREIPTGRRFLGSLVGDHSKTAIGTRLMTGTYVGFCCQLAGSGLAPRFFPSFTFWTDRGMEKYEMNKAIEVIQRVFSRRDRQWTPTDEAVMRYVEKAAPPVEV